MGRDSKLKFLTLAFTLVTVLSLSACVVASAPSSGLRSAQAPDPTPTPEVDAPTPTPEPTPEPDEEPAPREREENDSTDDDASDDTGDVDVTATDPATDDDEADHQSEEPEEPVPGNPVRLQIDSIDVDAPFEYVGVTDEGDMDVPQEWDNVAWYEPGTVPGDRGNAVVAGHYDSDIGPAVFIDLNKLAPGDEIRIITEDDEELVFEVTEVESVHVDDADPSKIFGSIDERNLNLITCEGVWDRSAEMYDHRLIVYTTLVSG